MSTTVLVIVAGILAVGIVLCVATLLAVQIGSKRKRAPDQRGDVCPRCHLPLPQDATSCPACSRTPPEPLPPTAKSDQPTPALIGTPEYLSPEQAQGEQSIQPTADIYALGIVLYELLAGQVPFPLPSSLSE